MAETSPTMTSAPAASSKATHTCPSCSRTFSRGEHLDRHLTTHLPSNTSKTFICSSCSKGFTRKDVLTRHVRAVHETKRSDIRKSRRRSCRRCAGFKIKCTGGGRGTAKDGTREGGRADDPCEACKKRGTVCIYDFGTIAEGGLDKEPGSEMRRGQGGGGNGDELGSEEAASGSESDNGISESIGRPKRRRQTHTGSYTTDSTSKPLGDRSYSIMSQVSPHLLSAAHMASSSKSASPDRRPGAFATSSSSMASLQNLFNSAEAAELAEADKLMSIMTTNTYGQLPSGSVNDGGVRPLEKTPSAVDTAFRAHPQDHSSSTGHNAMGRLPSCDLFSDKAGNFGSLHFNTSDNGESTNFSAPMTTSFPPLSLRDILSSPSQIGESLRDSLVTVVGGLVTITEGDIHGASAFQGIKLVPESRSPGTQKATDIIAFFNDGSEGYKATGSPSFLPDRTHENKPPEAEPSNSTTAASDDSSTNRHGLECTESLPGLSLEESWFFDYEIFDKSTDWLRGWGDWPAAPQKEGQANNCALSDLNHSTAPGAVPNLTITAGVGSSKRVASPVSVCSDEGSLFKIKHHDDHQTRLPAVRPIKDHNSVEDFLPWGWQSSREKLERRVTLPPLRQILEELTPQAPTVTQAYSPANVNKDESWIDDRILNDMVSLLSIPVERFPYESADMSKFPSKTMIDSFIKIYFEQFHSILPMIHKPTFSTGTCPTIVLVAMASIGASYSHLEGAKMFADSLSELCKRTLTWMVIMYGLPFLLWILTCIIQAEHNPEYPHSDFFLMASCLQSVYALGSGSHRLYDCADVSRSALIGSARRIGLFSGRVSPPSSSPGSAPGSPNPKTTRDEDNCNEKEAIEVRWRRWYVKEKLRRLAWSIFEYDCSFSTLSNRRGAITLNDISTRMPCAEALWQAPTAQAWGALLESGVLPPGAEKGTPFYPTLRDVISGKMSPENLTSWGRRLCAQAIGRILWDFKELEESVLSEGSSAGNDGGLGLPMLSPGLKPAKEKLLKSLMVICEGVRERQMEAGWRDGEVDGDRAHMTFVYSSLYLIYY